MTYNYLFFFFSTTNPQYEHKLNVVLLKEKQKYLKIFTNYCMLTNK